MAKFRPSKMGPWGGAPDELLGERKNGPAIAVGGVTPEDCIGPGEQVNLATPT